MDLDTAEIFNLTQPNQKSYDNNSMDLSLTDQLKLYEALDLDPIEAAADFMMDNATVVTPPVAATVVVPTAAAASAPAAVDGGSSGGGSSSSSNSSIAGGASANENCGSGGSAAATMATAITTTVGGPKPTMNGVASGGGSVAQQATAAVDRSISRNSSISSGSAQMMGCNPNAGGVGGGGSGGGGGGGTDVDLMDGALEDDAGSLSDDTEQECKICKSPIEAPRLLSCLHGFCLACLEALMIDRTGDSRNGTIKCPVCQQATAIGSSGPSALHPDYMLTNILDLNAIEPKALNCTSCKSKDQAMSRCNDCANFLCAACDNAHKYMRCFENHAVVLLADLRGSDEKVVIHKPLFCTIHPIEMLKYYCFSCQTVACNECVVVEHKGIDHRCEQITDADKRVRTEMEELVTSARAKITACHTNVTNMHNSLTELQSQHDTARDAIESNYASFRSILDKCREKALKDLDRLHSERELNIMDSMHIVEQATERIQSTCRFASNVLQKANGPELLSLKQLITNQIHNSLQNTPKIERNYSLEFDSKVDKFEVLAMDTFGRFRTESTPGPKESTPPPTLPGMPPMLQKGNTSSNGGMTGSHTASSPISMPNSMQSSFDGDMLGSNFMMPPDQSQTVLPPMPNPHHDLLKLQREQPIGTNAASLLGVGGVSNAPPPMVSNSVVMNGLGAVSVPNLPAPSNGSNMSGLTSIAEYNLHRLANLVDNHPLSQQQQQQQSQLPQHHHHQQQQQQQHHHNNHHHHHNHNNDHHMNEDVVSSAVVGNGVVGMGGMPVVPNTPQFTLADLISGDQRAFSQSLQALAKFNINGNGPQPMNRGQSPGGGVVGGGCNGGGGGGMDNGSILSDFASLAGSTSPIGTMGGDDMTNMSGMSMASSMSMAGRSKATPMQIRCKFGSLGASKAQFNSPHGFCLGVEEEIIVADTNNHRIEVFEKNGTFKFQFGVPGKEEGQLWYPRKVAVMRTTGKFVVCDRGNERSRMQIFTKNGHFMKKIAIRYIDIVAGLAVTNQGHIVAVDSVSPTVFIISEDGDLVHWFDCSDYMREPSDIAISGTDFYVCDFKGHNVAVFNENGTFQHRIGDEKITCFPNGIDISDAGDILIGDSHGNRFHVACFSREGVLQSEFECPHVKVSRCCGLKITSEGYVVTLAKNNHHVLVLNTLYIQ